jgi:peptidoglycan L-alanyl-D-glutamate endopeptidase CwlK
MRGLLSTAACGSIGSDGVAVIFLAVSGYFLIVASAGTLLVFPRLRAALAGTVAHASERIRRDTARIGQRGLAGLAASGGSAARAVEAACTFIRARRSMVAAAATLLIIPPLFALTVHTPGVLEFSDDGRVPDRRIAQLLQGEQLVPPPRLPPEVFTTREVVLVRPAAAWASRDWALLDEQFRQRLLLVFRLMRERHGYELALLEGYRSPQRQETLAAQGPHVTRAGAHMSYHQTGRAADIAFYRDGKLVISERDPWAMEGYRLYGAIAEELGMTWGGRWQMNDLGHVELRRAGVRQGGSS